MNDYLRIFATADTHGLARLGDVQEWAASAGLSAQDLLLVAGDSEIMNREHRSAVLDAFAGLPCDCAVIDGNHDDYRAMCEAPAVGWCGGAAHKLAPNVLALRRGEVYAPAGKTLWVFGGAMMKGYEPAPCEQLPGELPTDDDFLQARNSLARQGFRVDLILTHDGPESIVGARQYDPVRPFLEWVKSNVSYGLWIYGHHHQNPVSVGNVQCVFGRILYSI